MDGAESFQKDCLDEPYSKRRDCKLVDRISDLPDGVRTDIISLLPIQDAIKTYVVSQSWSRIVSSLPILQFDDIHFPIVAGKSDEMVKSINWTIAHHDASNVDTLAISFNIWLDSCPLMNDAWVNFAVQHNVRSLQLVVRIDEGRDFPSGVFTCKSLDMLKLQTRGQILRLLSYIFLPNITELLLFGIKFPTDTLTEQLFSGCPLLDFFFVRECCMSLLTRFSISSKTLKNLCIIDSFGITGCGIYLECPSLENFNYEGAMAQDFEFKNVDLLAVVELICHRVEEDGRNDSDLGGLALKLLNAVSTARILNLNHFFNKILYNVRNELWRLRSFENLNDACLRLFTSRKDEALLLTLLGKFQQVEKLHIILKTDRFLKMDLKWRTRVQNYPFGEFLGHLKFVEIEKFRGLAFEMGFLRFLIENAKLLTYINIVTPENVGKQYGLNYPPNLDEEFKQGIRSKVAELSNCFPRVSITIF